MYLCVGVILLLRACLHVYVCVCVFVLVRLDHPIAFLHYWFLRELDIHVSYKSFGDYLFHLWIN